MSFSQIIIGVGIRVVFDVCVRVSYIRMSLNSTMEMQPFLYIRNLRVRCLRPCVRTIKHFWKTK